MTKAAASRGRLNELDALRGIGALLVVNFHYSTRFHEMFPAAGHAPFHLFGGNYRVLLFFAISGFAIFFSMKKLARASDFVAGRAARLLPAYWAAMCVTLAVEHIGHATALYIPTYAAFANLTMLEQFFFLPPVDGAYWTLTVEIGFYMSMLALWLLFRLRHIERLIMAWLTIKLALVLVFPDMPERIVMVLVLRYVPFFAIGMVSYRVWSGDRTWRQQVPVLFAILLTIAVGDTADLIVVGIVLIAVFWAMIAGHLQWLCLRPLVWIGQISYSLYLIHQNVGFTIMLTMDQAGYPPMLAYVVAVATAVVLGYLLHRTIEKPVSGALLELWRRRRVAPVVAQGA